MSAVAVTLPELASQLGTRYDRLLEYERRESDPLPSRLLPGRSKGRFVLVSEFEEWAKGNCPLYKERSVS